MHKKFTSYFKPLLRSLFAIVLVVALAFGHSSEALAARGGGRIGGGSFRAPSSRTFSAPRTYAPPGGGGMGGGFGGGFGFPFLFPFFIGGGGGGGLFTLLIFVVVANFLVQSFRRAREENGLGEGGASANPTVSVAKLQVGLLAGARELQADLNRLASTANTSSTAGLAEVLQETSLALLRHPEYWFYGTTTVQATRLESAENQFNRLLLTERSKFSGETLSNVNNQLKQASTDAALAVADKAGALTEQAPGEYIVVTLLVGTEGALKLPTINSSEDMRQALQQLGGVASDRLLALEVLWTPQADNDVLTNEDVIAEYPDLKLI